MTIKQKTAIQKIVENGGNVSKAMRQAGYSEATINNPSNLTKVPAVRNELERLLKENNITQSQYMVNLGLGMQAMKQNQFTGEVTADITTRLSANKQAERFISFDSPPTNEQPIDMTGMNEVELTQAVFRRSDA